MRFEVARYVSLMEDASRSSLVSWQARLGGIECVVSRGRESTSALGGCAGKLEVSRRTTNSSELPH